MWVVGTKVERGGMESGGLATELVSEGLLLEVGERNCWWRVTTTFWGEELKVKPSRDGRILREVESLKLRPMKVLLEGDWVSPWILAVLDLLDPELFSLCNFLMCFFRSKFRQNPLEQTLQVKGFFSLCVCMWNVRLYTWWNALLHIWHLNAFSPECVNLWFL